MNLPHDKTLKGLRDRALLATLLYHGLRREELCRFKSRTFTPRRGVPHLRVHGKGNKARYIPLHAGTQELLNDYLDEARHAADTEGALFRPVSNNRTGELDNTITPDGVYKLVRRYALALGLKIGAHALRATAATNALDHDADIAKVQELAWTCQYRHHPDLRPTQNEARRFTNFQSQLLSADPWQHSLLAALGY